MDFLILLAVLLAVVFVGAIFFAVSSQKVEDEKLARMSPEERKDYRLKRLHDNVKQKWGATNSEFVCPHCQTKGMVTTKKVERKKGVSGGKAAAAVITGGVSVLATGLSRKERMTQAHCMNCHNTWDF
jgi:hypothetical protein